MAKKTKYFKEGDRRGKHRKKRKTDQQSSRPRPPRQVCENCGSHDFEPCPDNSSDMCSSCGACGVFKNIVPTFDQIRDANWVQLNRNLYHNRNYFAERMRQFTNTEPRFTVEEENHIRAIHRVYESHSPQVYEPKNMYKDQFRRIFGTLKQELPGMKYDKRLERWLQARVLLCPEATVGSVTIAETMKTMFDAVADTWLYKMKKQPDWRKKNIFNIDLLCLIMLYNIDPLALELYGWYFLTPEIIFATDSVKKNWARYAELLQLTNTWFPINNQGTKKATVRDSTVEMFLWEKFKFVVPELDELVNVATRGQQGETILYHEIRKHLLKIK